MKVLLEKYKKRVIAFSLLALVVEGVFIYSTLNVSEKDVMSYVADRYGIETTVLKVVVEDDTQEIDYIDENGKDSTLVLNAMPTIRVYNLKENDKGTEFEVTVSRGINQEILFDDYDMVLAQKKLTKNYNLEKGMLEGLGVILNTDFPNEIDGNARLKYNEKTMKPHALFYIKTQGYLDEVRITESDYTKLYAILEVLKRIYSDFDVIYTTHDYIPMDFYDEETPYTGVTEINPNSLLEIEGAGTINSLDEVKSIVDKANKHN